MYSHFFDINWTSKQPSLLSINKKIRKRCVLLSYMWPVLTLEILVYIELNRYSCIKARALEVARSKSSRRSVFTNSSVLRIHYFFLTNQFILAFEIIQLYSFRKKPRTWLIWEEINEKVVERRLIVRTESFIHVCIMKRFKGDKRSQRYKFSQTFSE